jgi:hypothetical protein
MIDTADTLADKQAIAEVLSRYCHAVDRIDPELGSKIWHPDATAHYEGIFEGTGQDLMAFVFEAHRLTDATSHQLANILIDLDGDQATAESYVHACIRSGGSDIVVRGRYSDALSRRDGEWRIDDRRYRHDLVQVFPVAEVPDRGDRT